MIGTIVSMIKYGFPIRKLKNLLFGDEGISSTDMDITRFSLPG